MWISWALIGLLQISTIRYGRAHWKWNKLVHLILGLFASALVFTAGMLALNFDDYNIKGGSFHGKVGFSVFVLGLILAVGGMLANIIRMKTVMAWNSKRTLLIGKVHRYAGWLIILLGQVAIGSGAYRHWHHEGNDAVGWTLAGVSTALFFILLLAQEIRY